MRFRTIATSMGMMLLATSCWAHSEEELGHHWYVPKYRTEMVTQIAMMAAVALVVLTGLWLERTIRTRRARG